MTTTARLVLADCEWALARHANDLRFEAFRVSWMSIVTLLRVVGHALDKVDRHRSPTVNAAIDAWWERVTKTKPDPAIFWQFIDEERNAVIKTYRYARPRHAHREPPATPGSLNPSIDVTYHSEERLQLQGFEFTTTTPLANGPFRGKLEREVAELAITWWHEQLDAIDRAAGTPESQPKVVSIR